MPIETINILIGAGIALVASVITGVVTHIFQMRGEKQKREWEIEDYKRDKRHELEKERLAQAEEWAESYMRSFSELKSRLTTLALKASTPDEFSQWLKIETETPKTHSYGEAILHRINDSELLDLSKDLREHWFGIYKILKMDPTGDEQIDTVGVIFLVNSEFEGAVKKHGDFIKRLDEIKLSIDS